jgi:hypothetical protein
MAVDPHERYIIQGRNVQPRNHLAIFRLIPHAGCVRLSALREPIRTQQALN